MTYQRPTESMEGSTEGKKHFLHIKFIFNQLRHFELCNRCELDVIYYDMMRDPIKSARTRLPRLILCFLVIDISYDCRNILFWFGYKMNNYNIRYIIIYNIIILLFFHLNYILKPQEPIQERSFSHQNHASRKQL